MKKLLVLLMVLIVGCSALTTNPKKVGKNSEVYYQIFVGSFADSNQDGIGDLKGITSKLDYLDGLGITGLWLTPIHPSETYHKYDVDDYLAIDPAFGTMDDFKELVAKAKEKNIKVIMDLVLNHSSDTHPWFVAAKSAALNNKCEEEIKCGFYNFSTSMKPGYAKLRENLFYEAKFWSGMPDLNLQNETLKAEIDKIVKFYSDLGVSGFRLDAVSHFGHTIAETKDFLVWLNDKVKHYNPNAFIVGEAWEDPNFILSLYETKVDAFFDFSIADFNGKIVTGIRNEDGQKMAKEIVEYDNEIKQVSPKSTNATFITNHDMSRSAGFLIDGSQRKLAASINFLSPGIPFMYYGEELAMKGSGKDENKRLAMTWGENNDAKDPTHADYKSTHGETVKGALQDSKSLLNYYKKIISIRHQYIKKDSVAKNIELENKAIFALDYGNVHVYINLSENDVSFKANEILDKAEIGGSITYSNGNVTMKGYGVVITKP